jgi:asparagine synthase (glutamine-hydrolysing)
MCGIVGEFNLTPAEPPAEETLRRMLGQLRHRGPDEFGTYRDLHAGLGSARLSIVDLAGGQQPIGNEDGSLWIVFNGEIYNHVELRPELERKGHRFTTHSDTEVLLHLFEEHGADCLPRLNGQFAFAIWNARDRSLFLARDRLGVRPLFYARGGNRLVFASEIKAVLAEGSVPAVLDPVTLDQVFTFWSPLSPRTAFAGVSELPPAHYLLAKNGTQTIVPYWRMSFPEAEGCGAGCRRSDGEYLEEFAALLTDAVSIRLRADVPVGAYLSGGLDSSVIASIVRGIAGERLDTFSIAFRDAAFDESLHQRRMADALGTQHQVVFATEEDIGRVFPDVVWHAEVPLMRTAPAPMYLLSALVRDRGYKVVLTGEGADEFLAGYDILKEAQVRRFWARQPRSTCRPRLLQRLYPDIAALNRSHMSYLAAFFGNGLEETGRPDYSHAVRWRNNRRTCRFFSHGLKEALAARSPAATDSVFYPPEFERWGGLEKAQFLESSIFLSQYLLSSQGDRMAMAHSVEGRFPFLDPRVVEFCNALPVGLKLRGLKDKRLLRRFAGPRLPQEIVQRPKRPYRAPIHRCFFGERPQPYVEDLLAPDSVRRAGWFDPGAVSALAAKLMNHGTIGETDEMALTGMVSTQLLHRLFVERREIRPPVGAGDRIKAVDRLSQTGGTVTPAAGGPTPI